GSYVGGLYMRGGRLDIASCTFANNVGSFSGNGALHTEGSSTVTIMNSTFAGNAAGGTFGGYGGAIYINSTGPVTIRNSTIANNVASSGAGGIYINSQPASVQF